MRRALLGLSLAVACAGPPAPRPRPIPPVPAAPAAAAPHARTLAAGGTRSCLVDAGEVYCWGMGAATPTRVDGLSGAVSIAVHDATVCAIDAARNLTCTIPAWSAADPSPEVERFDALGPVLDVTLGPQHACALTENHEITCWGGNTQGELGVETPRRAYVPVRPGLSARAIVAGNRPRTCRVTDDGDVDCWGAPFDYTDARVFAPATVTRVDGGALVATGIAFGCAAREGGPLACWGRVPSPGRSPYAETDDSALCPLPDARAIAAGHQHLCALDAAGRVRCLAERSAERGDGVDAARCDEARAVQDLEDVVEIAAGADHTCARRADGSVACWGAATEGRLGACGGARLNPRRVEGLGRLRDLGVGSDGVCVLDRAGAVTCWGRARLAGAWWSPAAPMATGMERLWMGPQDVCVSGGDGFVYCFGEHAGATPTPLAGVSHPRAVAIGRFEVLVLSEDGAIRCFGCDRQGAVGATFLGAPTVVGRVPGAVELVDDFAQYCARTSEGRVLCGFAGQSGDARAPAEVLGARGAVSIAIDRRAGYAVLGDGRVVRWALDAIPLDATVTPVAIDGVAVRVVSGDNTCVITDAGALHCWGPTLGHHLGESEYRVGTPREIVDVPSVSTLALRVTMGCALVEGDAWCWGPGEPREAPAGAVLREVCVPRAAPTE